MNNEFSLKELYEVRLRATYPIEIAGRSFEKGETICLFDKIQIFGLADKKKFVSARGGYGNKDWVFWEDRNGIELTFSQGIFNIIQFSLLCNSQVNLITEQNHIRIPNREVVESDEEGRVQFSQIPCGSFFVYNASTGEKLNYTIEDEKTLIVDSPYLNVLLDYYYDYSGDTQMVTLGRELTEGFLRLEGKTRVKDDITGKTRTGIIEIPKLKLMSGLSMRLGKKANPVVADFQGIAVPTGVRGATSVVNIFFLEDDIDEE